jgi:chromosome segregation ATPase
MPRKTDGEKIDEMEKVVAMLIERIDNVREGGQTATRGLADVEKAIGEPKTEIVHLRRDLEGLQKWKDDLKKEKDESSRRLWAFGPNIVGALISAIVGGGVAYLVTHILKP